MQNKKHEKIVKGDVVLVKVDNDFIETTMIPDVVDRNLLEKAADEYNSILKKIYIDNPDINFKILMGLNNTSINSFIGVDGKTENKAHEITDLEQTVKVAVLGDDGIQNRIVELLFSRFTSDKANFFTDRQRALRWLDTKVV